MSNNKQSSIGILEDFLLQRCVPIMDGVKWHEFKLVIEQAKSMHKKEIMDAYEQGNADCYWELKDNEPRIFKNHHDYYNEIFNNDGNPNN